MLRPGLPLMNTLAELSMLHCNYLGDYQLGLGAWRAHMAPEPTCMLLRAGAGKYYSVNVPLKEGMDDASYEALFKPIMRKVMETFRPGAVVLQSGEWMSLCSVTAVLLPVIAAVLHSGGWMGCAQ